MPRRFSRKAQAQRLLDEGVRLHDEGQDEQALAAYAEAARWDRRWATPWYNTGLIHKYSGRWKESFEANLRAVRFNPKEPAAIWNLGIAATAMGEWSQARQAWRRYGIAVQDGEGPVDYFIGTTPIRVSVDHNPEVVWADRIDPARAILRNVPTPACGRRYGDLVLHDGAPMGYRMLCGRERAVFNELAVIEPSAYSTFEVEVAGVSQQEVDALIELADRQDITVENWSTNFRVLCKACSEGRPHDDREHDHGPAANTDGEGFRLGIAARSRSKLEAMLKDWCASLPHARLGELRCVLKAQVLREVGVV